jgi:hypothetical protein
MVGEMALIVIVALSNKDDFGITFAHATPSAVVE